MKAVALACRVMFGILALLVLAALIREPFATNDGPVHMAFSDLIANFSDPVRELQRQVYQVDLRLTPNLLPYLMMAKLSEFGSVRFVETVVQALCLLGPMAACWFALRTIRRENAWLAIFVFPLSLNQLFFYGLYNYCLSTALFFLAVAAYWWLNQARSPFRAIILGAALSLTFATHAGGFAAATTGVAALAAAHLVLALRRTQERFVVVLRRQWHAFFSMLIPVPLVMMTMSESAGAPIEFGPGLRDRLLSSGQLSILRQTGGIDTALALSLSLGMLALMTWGLVRMVRGRDALSFRQMDDLIATLVAFAASVALMFVFPDTMGGGWTHFYRLILFPFFWIVILSAQQCFPTSLKLGVLGFASVVSLVLLWTTMRHESIVRAQISPIQQVDRFVGTHCTVLPVVLASRPVDSAGRILPSTSSPYFQAASRLEATRDRVVLFNYLARLPNYPVRFAPQFEPQKHIFHWPPYYRGTTFEVVDVSGFEKASGIPVDYLLVIGERSKLGDLGEALEALLTPAEKLFGSPDRRVELYLRPRQASSRCIVSPTALPAVFDSKP